MAKENVAQLIGDTDSQMLKHFTDVDGRLKYIIIIIIIPIILFSLIQLVVVVSSKIAFRLHSNFDCYERLIFNNYSSSPNGL